MYYSDYNRPPEEREPIIETDQFHVHGNEPPKKKNRAATKFVALGLCCALVGGLVGGGSVWAASRLAEGSSVIYQGTGNTTAVSLANVDGQTVLTPEEIYAANLGAVVGVNGNVDTNVWGYTVKNAVSGSGFVISSNSTTSYILTNYHVIDGVSDITVFFADGKSYDATLVGGEEDNDIAVLKVDVGNLQTVVLGDSDSLNVGESVYAIGNPLGELTFTFTDGMVSALDRLITTTGTDPDTQQKVAITLNVLQTNCDINPGNSGGPLFDSYGNVVGIVTAKYTQTSSGVSAEGLGFALPINDVKEIINDLIEHGYVTGKPYLGIQVQDVSSEAQRYGISAGAAVLYVADGSCAQEAGLQVNDIIIAIDDTAIDSSSALTAALSSNYKAGDTVTLTVIRNQEQVQLSVTLDEQNEQTEAANQIQEQSSQNQQNNSQSGGSYYNNWPFGGFFW